MRFKNIFIQKRNLSYKMKKQKKKKILAEKYISEKNFFTIVFHQLQATVDDRINEWGLNGLWNFQMWMLPNNKQNIKRI